MAFTHTKKVEIWLFIKARIRIRIQPKRSGSYRIRNADFHQLMYEHTMRSGSRQYRPDPQYSSYVIVAKLF
jgi:hypothetical protein